MREYFCIELSNQVYLGLFLEHVDKIIQLNSKDICVIPGIANFWLGVANYKSSLLWILDTDNLLNIDNNNNQLISQQTALILNYSIDNTPKRIALAVQGIQGVITVEQAQNIFSPESISSVLQNTCDAITSHDGKDIYLVNTETLLQYLSQNSLLFA